jgi:hypothetical protein
MQESRANSAACGRRGRVFVIVRWSLAIASLVLVVRQSGAGAESLSTAINGPNDSGICGVAAAPYQRAKRTPITILKSERTDAARVSTSTKEMRGRSTRLPLMRERRCAFPMNHQP